MPSIALKDESEKLAGFLLVSGEEPLVPSPARGCVFMVAPFPFASPAKNALSERKQQFSVAIAETGEGVTLMGACAPGEIFEATLPASGLGAWSLTTEDRVVKGVCELAKRR